DTRHFFRVRPDAPVTHVRLDVYPDGGLARLRINGEVDEAALHAAVVRWLDLLPESHAVQVLTSGAGSGTGRQDLHRVALRQQVQPANHGRVQGGLVDLAVDPQPGQSAVRVHVQPNVGHRGVRA